MIITKVQNIYMLKQIVWIML